MNVSVGRRQGRLRRVELRCFRVVHIWSFNWHIWNWMGQYIGIFHWVRIWLVPNVSIFILISKILIGMNHFSFRDLRKRCSWISFLRFYFFI